MNVVLLVIDAFDQKRIEETNYKITPNLERLLKRGVKFTNVYSQAPYTEAALMSLYAGQNTLDNGGYMYRFGTAKKTIFECFNEAGYEVFCNTHQPQVFPSSQRRGIDYLAYDRPYDFDVLWRYRLQHYSSVNREVGLSEKDINAIILFVQDNFDEARLFLDGLDGDDESIRLLKNYDEKYDRAAARVFLDSEYKKFCDDKRRYCQEILTNGRDSRFFKMPVFMVGRYQLSNQMECLHDHEVRKLCKKILRKNIRRCLLRNGDFYRSLLRGLKLLLRKDGHEAFLKNMYMTKNSLVMTHLKRRYGPSSITLKEQPTFERLSNHFFDWLKCRPNKNRPFFANIHVDDIHFPEIFYSVDSDDVSLVKKELAIANETMKSIKGKGTVIHDLSLAYIDYHIGLFVDELDKLGMMDDTLVFVTADHGFSYGGFPIRQKDINTFYLENFKIPFYVFGGTFRKTVIDSKLSSLDIPYTICRLAGVNNPDSYKGLDAFKQERDVRFIEYCGGGCPDLDRREIMLAAFSSEKMLCFRFHLNDTFDWDKVTEVYNLSNDKLQKKNIVNSFDRSEFCSLFNAAEKRFGEIKSGNRHPILYSVRDSVDVF